MIPDDMLPPSDDSDNEDIGDMVVNTNRAQVVYEETDSSSDEEEADDSQHGVTINKDDETWFAQDFCCNYTKCDTIMWSSTGS